MHDYRIRIAAEEDLGMIEEIYNQNPSFLQEHLGQTVIDAAFLLNDQREMKAAGFLSCVVEDPSSHAVIGVIDYKPGTEVYLSLLMLHPSCQRQGCGQKIYHLFEKQMAVQGGQSIRIDVVANSEEGNSSSALPFWTKQGFVPFDETWLEWGQKRSQALVMRKNIACGK